MDDLKDLLKKFTDNYLLEKNNYQKAMKIVPSWTLLKERIPEAIIQEAGLSENYLVEGSIGKGMMTETPWICIFDTEITKSAQDGYYVVLLFKTDMSGAYLSLGQGWTQYKREYGQLEGRHQIIANCSLASQILRTLPDTSIKGILNLGATRPLGKGYQDGNISAFYYSADDLYNDNSFITDLKSLLVTYSELKSLVGNNIISLGSVVSDDIFQQVSQSSSPKEVSPGPRPKKEKNISSKTSLWPRDPRIAKLALINAGYKCENDKSHQTFISKASGSPYIESHHIIPMEAQENFEYNLDVPENIAALCPNCHREIHLAQSHQQMAILKKLYASRAKLLSDRGVGCTLSELGALYE
ncbi:MAG: DUF3578 domain-containing protein [Pseudomonadota bacterium]|nr:DUF3578 domain-containing protein [Pseudomonadota bacterium]